jgi:hypothetical protein
VSVKVCRRCGEEKPLADFHKQPTGPQGRHSWCRPCANAYAKLHRRRGPLSVVQRRRLTLLTKYRLTPAEWEEMAIRQGGCCAICGQERGLVTDHDHATGRVRGLLCRSCNVAIAILDDPVRLPRALAYLERQTP